ncbi:hypothetical protein E2542_SST29745 [Spatholobus suberectus]|nr:hypothetical protein E2542_SST29745 [Spatholobus suberectus]
MPLWHSCVNAQWSNFLNDKNVVDNSKVTWAVTLSFFFATMLFFILFLLYMNRRSNHYRTQLQTDPRLRRSFSTGHIVANDGRIHLAGACSSKSRERWSLFVTPPPNAALHSWTPLSQFCPL